MTRRGGLWSERCALAVGLVSVIALGLLSRKVPLGLGLWDKSLGDVLYAVMIYLLAAIVTPTAQPRRLAVVAIAVCFGLEVFQLTGIPARAPRLLRFVLGTTFAWHDLGCYVVGAVGAGAVEAWVRRSRRAG